MLQRYVFTNWLLLPVPSRLGDIHTKYVFLRVHEPPESRTARTTLKRSQQTTANPCHFLTYQKASSTPPIYKNSRIPRTSSSQLRRSRQQARHRDLSGTQQLSQRHMVENLDDQIRLSKALDFPAIATVAGALSDYMVHSASEPAPNTNEQKRSQACP